MSEGFSLEQFTIMGLHGNRSIRIPIENNRLILVGENGSGKTTIITLLYFLLTQQWSRLAHLTFKSMSVKVNGSEFTLSFEQIKKTLNRRSRQSSYGDERDERLFHFLRYANRNSLDESVLAENPSALNEVIYQYCAEYRIPLTSVSAIVMEYFSVVDKNSELYHLRNEFEKKLPKKILYLPTYRRIEQDLKAIYPWIDTDREFRKREGYARNTKSSRTELVEFGMHDVDQLIGRKMDQLRFDMTESLKQLTSSYLSDIISGRYQFVATENLNTLDEEGVDSVLARIEANVLSATDKKRVRQTIQQIKTKSELNEETRTIAHFLAKLAKLYSDQQRNEREVRKFVDLCNGYLVGKKLVFDSYAFRVSVEADLDKKGIAKSHRSARNELLMMTEFETFEDRKSQSVIELKQLSSGEKQIVSLFSHLYLSSNEDFLVLIDEPELSLSVPWQKKFLVDIVETKLCRGLVAVTHSPFIFDNYLDHSAHSIEEFWKK